MLEARLVDFLEDALSGGLSEENGGAGARAAHDLCDSVDAEVSVAGVHADELKRGLNFRRRHAQKSRRSPDLDAFGSIAERARKCRWSADPQGHEFAEQSTGPEPFNRDAGESGGLGFAHDGLVVDSDDGDILRNPASDQNGRLQGNLRRHVAATEYTRMRRQAGDALWIGRL